MKKKYETIEALRAKCDEYMNNTKLWAPRAFRVYIGISKQTLHNYKKQQEDYFYLIKSYEDKILAFIEELAIFGALHPKLKGTYTKTTTRKDTTVKEVKFNQVGAIFTLRAYDKDQYAPELSTINHELETKEPIVIEMNNTSKNKLKMIGVKNDTK